MVFRKKLVFGATTVTAALALASAAFACTQFLGQSWVQVNGVDSSHAVADKGSPMSYCTVPSGVPLGVAGSYVITFKAQGISGQAGGCAGSKMPSFDQWRLTTTPGDWLNSGPPGARDGDQDCMADRLNDPLHPGVDISKPLTDIGLGYDTNNQGDVVAEAGAPANTAQSVPHTFSPGSHQVCLSTDVAINGFPNAPPSAPMNRVTFS